MARATATNAVSEQTLTSGVSIGGTTFDLTLTAGASLAMPSGSGVFACIIIETDADDAEVVECTRSGTTCTLTGATTFAKNHSAGAQVVYVQSAQDFANKISLDDPADQYLTGALIINKLGLNSEPQDFSGGTTLTLDDSVNLIGQYLAPTVDNCIVELGTATRGTVYVFTHGSAGISPITITDTPTGVEPVLIGFGQTTMFVMLGVWTCVTGAATAPDFGAETVYGTSGSPHTFTVPTFGVSQCQVEVVAGGGGGGGASGAGSQTAVGAGGGAGGGIIGVIDVVAGETLTVTVGAGGTAGGSGGTNGSSGGNSSIVRDSDASTLAIAYGGSGGPGMTTGTALAVVAGGQSGTASIPGDPAARTQAQSGDPGIRLSGTVAVSGGGGMSSSGSGTAGRTGSAVGYTTAGGTDAGGGGGGATTNSATGRAGGLGADGIVILRPLR